MADIRKRASIRPPLTACNRHEAIIWTFCFLYNLVRLAKDRCDLWLERGAEAVISHTFNVGRSRVEFVPHVLFRELPKCPSLDTKELKSLVYCWKIGSTDGIEHVVRES